MLTKYITLLLLSFFLLNPKQVFAQEPAHTFIFQDQTITVKEEDLDQWKGEEILGTSNLLEVRNTLKESLIIYSGQNLAPVAKKAYSHKLSNIYTFLENLKSELEIPVVEPVLVLNNSLVTNFIPPQAGLKIDSYNTAINTVKNLEHGINKTEVIYYEKNPLQNLADTNNLGIQELVARGKSNFSGSPKNRRHNIKIGTEKFKGVIIPKGEEFSFNEILGPVEEEQGFLPELVIKKTGTVPEFGGGLCQVSSTTFRAAMEAGLPITQRKNHSYAVQYYAPQGTDATIYPGVIDLKFINDTPGAILVWPYFTDKDNLVFDFYGSKDSRKVTLEKPVQYDRKTDGSMKATWTRIVEKDGEKKTDVFKSTYQPPALFHKTEEFASATTSPVTTP